VGVYLFGLGISAALRSQGDFAIYYLAGQRAAHHAALYPETDSSRFLYAPVFAIAFVPFGKMALGAAQSAWFVLNAVALLALIAGSGRLLFDDRRLPASLIVVPLLLVSRFVNNNVEHGQINLCALALIVWSIATAERHQPAASGLMLATAILIKPFGLLAALYLTLSKRVSPLLWTGLWIAVLLALPIAFFGLSSAIAETTSYIRAAASMSVRYHTMLTNQSSTSAAIRLLSAASGEPHAFLIGAGFEFVLMAGVSCWIMRSGDPGSRNGRLALCGLFCIMPSLAPVSWKSYYASLLPPYMALVSLLWTHRSREAGSPALARTLVGLSVLMNMVSGTLNHWALFYSFHFLSSLVVLSALIAASFLGPNHPACWQRPASNASLG